MKISLIIIGALLLNTTLLVAEPLSAIVKGINPLIFAGIEGLLLGGYFINKWLKDFRKACTLELSHLNIFVIE